MSKKPQTTTPNSGAEDVSVHDVMRKYDKESNTRIWTGKPRIIVNAFLAAFSVFAIVVTLFLTPLDEVRLTSFVACILVMGYLVYPASKKHVRENYIPWYDILIMLLGAGAFAYFCFNAETIILRLPMIKSYEVVIGIIGILALFELCRRCTGIPIMVVAGVFIVYALYYYGIKKNLGLGSVNTLVCSLFYKKTGILSTPINVCSKYIAVFIIFGAFLERTGISDFFIRLANSIAGSSAGGPAKVAVLSSALCGMVSGSSVGNTVTTGSVTIPMMKKTGYKPEFAGAVEAAASTGGQIMPPIMGAAAFLMVEYVNLPYSSIVSRAILPAVLYFAGIFICVHLEAKKTGLKGMDRSELPRIRPLLKQTYLLLPLVVLVWLVCTGSNTMAFAAAIAIVVAIVVSMFSKETRMTPARFFDALAAGGQGCISVAVACCIAGIVAGCLTMTGLATQILNAILKISGTSKFIALFLTMLCCIVLGMGVPTTANYCIMASTCAPILVKMGIPSVAAHFFVFYFGIVADITPPVALAAYAGSAIAKANPMKTAVNATKLAIAAFIIPYILVYNPQMVLVDAVWYEVIQIAITSFVGMFAVAAGLEGYLVRHMWWPLRIVSVAAGLLLIVPGTLTDVIGIVVVLGIYLFQRLRTPAAPKAAA
ncbi:MAG: TRAP transporter permease [Oscillospiraceae bacterium]